jgi:putative DNA primase/helicase
MMTAHKAADALGDFLNAMEAAGIIPRDRGAVAAKLALDAGLVRFRCDGERKANGWARLHLDGEPAGRFGNWRLGVVANWRAGRTTGTPAADRAAMALTRLERSAETQRGYDQAVARCLALWGSAAAADATHPYLAAKHLEPAGFRAHGEGLLIPMTDAAGRLWSLQTIYPDGSKRFAKGGRVAGSLWWRGNPGDVIAIGEGVATMAAVHAATGLCVVAAFSAGNLAEVSRAIRQRRPDARLILCADDDAGRTPNIGLESANAAARAVGGLVARPPQPPGWPAGNGLDFADTWTAPHGAEAIRRALNIRIGDTL